MMLVLPKPGAMVGRDIGEMTQTYAARAVELAADPETSAAEVLEIQHAWDAWCAANRRRQAAGRALMAATARKLEIIAGHKLTGMSGKDVPDISPNALYRARTFAKYEDVVMRVIEESSDASPASVNKVMESVRWEREVRGESLRGRRRTRPVLPPRNSAAARRLIEIERLERQEREVAGTSAAATYAAIRRLEKSIENIPAARDVYSALVKAEAAALSWARSEREE